MRFSEYAAKASTLIAAVRRGVSYPRSVVATFNIALSQAASQCAAAEMLMAFLAQCAPERIPMLLVRGALDDEDERAEALAVLSELSLLKHDPFADGTDAVTVHRLVQLVSRARSEATGLAKTAADRVIAALVAIYPEDGFDNPKSWPFCAQLTSHLFAVWALHTSSTNSNWPELLNRADRYFCGHEDLSHVGSPLRDALECERVFGPEHTNTATSLDLLGHLLVTKGDLASARPLYERSVAIRERVCGPEHGDTAHSLCSLGLLLHQQGDLANARRLF
jgi:hypothetical protein